MAIVEVKVPQLSESVSEATMLQWKKKPGEAVAQDEILTGNRFALFAPGKNAPVREIRGALQALFRAYADHERVLAGNRHRDRDVSM